MGIETGAKIEAVTDMTGGLFAELEPGELEELHAWLWRARKDCRKVMWHYWWNKYIIRAYSKVVTELSDADPLFARDIPQELADNYSPLKVTKVPRVHREG